MWDDLFIRSLVAGLGIAVTAGPVGCFVVWRRMSFFGDTLAHAALLGIALSLVFESPLQFGLLITALLASLLLFTLQRLGSIANDTILAILSQGLLAIGILAISFSNKGNINLERLLVGDILAITATDLTLIYGGGTAILLLLFLFWRPLFAATISPAIAEAEGQRPAIMNIFFIFLLAVTIAVAVKIIGVLLISALLIIPAASARYITKTPEAMAVGAALIGMLAVYGGVRISWVWDSPTGPSIILAAFLIFWINALGRKIWQKWQHKPPQQQN